MNGKYTDALKQKILQFRASNGNTFSLYGQRMPEERLLTYTIQGRNIKWKDLRHYSARQKAMKLGGCIGDFSLSGTFSKRDISLLEFGAVSGWKNTNFGLAKLRFE